MIKSFKSKEVKFQEIKYHPDNGMKSEVLFNEETRLIANMQPTVHRVYGNLYQRVEKKMNSLSKHCLAE